MSPVRSFGLAGVVLLVVLVTACGASPGGSARLTDDTGRPDAVDGGGWVAIVPADRAADLWRAAGTEPPADLPYAAVPLTRSQVESVGGVAEDVSEDGEFELGITGSVLLCRVPGDGEEAATRGCGESELEAGSKIVISFGEAGFRVTTES